MIARADAPSDSQTSRFIKRIVKTPANTYFTYPHANGFLPDGRCVIASRPNGSHAYDLDYLAFDLDRETCSKLAHARDARMYWSLSANGIMAYPSKDGVSIIDLNQAHPTVERIYTDPYWVVHGDIDISRDGAQILVTRSHYQTPEDYQMDIVDINTRVVKSVLDPGWQMDHAHFSPYDPAWICYCDNRQAMRDRLWVWNRAQAPKGRHLFNQIEPDGHWYDIGHERAMFDKPALLVVAYGGHGTARPGGLFEVSFDGDVRLVSASNQDFHCNVSRDGSWAVVSLQGSYDPAADRPNEDWSNAKDGCRVSDVMLVNMRSGARAFLYRGSNAMRDQPYEVQPSISPDGRYVLCKDAREQNVHALELDSRALNKFLSL